MVICVFKTILKNYFQKQESNKHMLFLVALMIYKWDFFLFTKVLFAYAVIRYKNIIFLVKKTFCNIFKSFPCNIILPKSCLKCIYSICLCPDQ